MHQRPETERLYSVPDLAERWGVSESTMWRLIREGKETRGRAGLYPTVSVRRQTRVAASVANRYLERNAIRA